MTAYQEFPPALMVLSPRVTKAGDPASSVVGINTTPVADGAITYCLENKLAYRLDKTSVAAPDGNLILAPLYGPGRWLAAVAPSAVSALVQVGWDQPLVSDALTVTGSGPSAQFPRDGIGTPLQVFFPAVTRGNQVEVSWNATLGNAVPNDADVRFTAIAAVALVPTPSFPDDFCALANSQGGVRIGPPLGELQADAQFDCCSGSASFTVPAGTGTTVPLTVQLFYICNNLPLLYGGVNLGGFVPGTGVTLKAAEYTAANVTQPGPGLLSCGE